jgi:quercetin dioxygenase-like cupin family protein
MTRGTVIQALVAGGLLALMTPAWGAELAAAAGPSEARKAPLTQRMLLSTATTVTGQPIHYPQGAAHVTAVEIMLAPGEETGWHTHPVPMFGYILAGELTVDYGPLGKRVYRTGDALVEAIGEAHNGRNTGEAPTRILAIVAGVKGTPGSFPAPPPVRSQAAAQ